MARTYPVRSYLLVFLAFLQAGLTSGIIFGWPSLESMLISIGAYQDRCKLESPNDVKGCTDLIFARIFTVGVFFNNAAPIFTGVFLDHFGPKITSIASALLFFLGLGAFAISETFYIYAFTLLGFSGPGIYVAIMHTSNLFPGHQPFVLSVYSGTFTISSLVFKVFEKLLENNLASFSHLFLIYIFICVPFFVVGIFVWPNKPFSADEILAAEAPKSPETEHLMPAQPVSTVKSRDPPLYNKPKAMQLMSPQFWSVVAWQALQQLHVSFYLGSIVTTFGAHPDYVEVFNWVWLLGILAIPLFGVFMDHKGTSLTFLMASVMCLLYSVLAALYNPHQPIAAVRVQYVTFLLITIANVGMWGMFYTYLGNTFGFQNFGTILGVAAVTVAVTGTIQYPLLANMNYAKAFDWLFVGISIPLFVVPFYLLREDRNVNRYLRLN